MIRLTPAYFEFENGALSLKSNTMGSSVSMWSNQQNTKIDYVLPAQIDEAPVQLNIPPAFIQIVSALVYFFVKTKGFHSFNEIPQLGVEFEYYDIAGTKHKSKFNIKTIIVAVTNDCETFQGYVESSKIV